MPNLIYQHWNGPPTLPGAKLSSKMIRGYAAHIGSDYRFDEHKAWTRKLNVDPRWFEDIRPIYDPTFDHYDNILVLDADIYPVRGLTPNIFDEFPGCDFGMCEEPHQPAMRQHSKSRINGANDERWAALVRTWGSTPPRDDQGRLLVFNTGLVLLSREARLRARAAFMRPADYVAKVRAHKLPSFYTLDQNYLHAMAFMGHLEFTRISPEWNRQVHATADGSTYDARTQDTKLVHIQYRGADHWPDTKLLAIINA